MDSTVLSYGMCIIQHLLKLAKFHHTILFQKLHLAAL